MDTETTRLLPEIKGTRADWTVTPRNEGSGTWGHVSNGILNPLQYDLIEKIQCKFVSKAFYKIIDGTCYMGIYGFIQMAQSYMLIAFALWTTAVAMKLLWRMVEDNAHAKRSSGRDQNIYHTRSSRKSGVDPHSGEPLAHPPSGNAAAGAAVAAPGQQAMNEKEMTPVAPGAVAGDTD